MEDGQTYFDPRGQEVQLKPDRGNKLTKTITIFGSLFGILSLIYLLRDHLSSFIQTIVLIILILYLFILIYVFFFDIIHSRFNYIRQKRKRNKIACEYLLELKILVEKFDKLTETHNSLTGVFDKLRSDTNIYKYLNQNDVQLNRIKDLLSNLDKAIDSFDKTEDDFKLIIHQFDAVIRIYADLYVKNTLRDIKSVESKSELEVIPKNIRDEYETRRNNYDKFLDKYIEFGEKVNNEFGGSITNVYIERFEKL